MSWVPTLLTSSAAAAHRLVTWRSEVGGARGIDCKLTTQQALPPQVRPEFDPDSQVLPMELSSPWWWDDFHSFLLEGIADMCGSQEGGGPDGSAYVSELLEVRVRERKRE